MQVKLLSHNAEETRKLGELLSSYLFPSAVITLTGDLGAGKTTFASGVAKGLEIDEKVASPTFNIMKCYFAARIPMFHIDAYRLNEGNKDIGLEEFIEGDGVCLIEWPNFIEELLDENTYLNIDIRNLGEDEREILIKTNNRAYKDFISYLEGK